MDYGLWCHESYIVDLTKRTQLRFLNYINKFLYPFVIITIIFQKELRALRYATSMIISTRRILLATYDQIKEEKVYPGSNIILKIISKMFFYIYVEMFSVTSSTFMVIKNTQFQFLTV